MKKTIITSLVISFLILVNSCGKCIETQLTKVEKEWFSVYQQNQIIIFKSNLGNFDTIVVTEKIETHNNKNCNYYGIGPLQPHVMLITLKSKICHNESYCDGGIFISKDRADRIFNPSFRLFGLLQNREDFKLNTIKLSTTGKMYKNAYYFEDGINSNNFGNNFLKCFYWDKKGGLIRYDTSDGEIFELISNK